MRALHTFKVSVGESNIHLNKVHGTELPGNMLICKVDVDKLT